MSEEVEQQAEAEAPEGAAPEGAVTFKELANIDDAVLNEIEARGRQLYEDKKYSEARALFRGLATVDPYGLDYYRMYAAASVGDGDNNAALEALEMAIGVLDILDADPAYKAELLAFQATILIKSEKRVEAHRVAEEALALGPEDAPWREVLEKGLEDLEGALKLVLSKNPHTDSSEVVGLRLEEAEAEGRPLAWVFGYDDEALLQLHADAINLVRQGSLESARRIVEGLVALDPSVPLFHTSLATVCELIGDYPAAEQALNSAVRIADGVPEGDDLLATARFKRGIFLAHYGDREKARQDLEAALAADIGDEEREEANQVLQALAEENDNPSDDRPDKDSGSATEKGSESARGPPAS
jgi:tetratricopeptide (TPR) repeat protein